jgi:YVTN family beta-propeller protein
VAIAPDGNRLYVGNGRTNTVSVIDTATNTVTATITPFAYPNGITVSPDGANAYVANSNGNNVSVVDTATNTVLGTIPVGANPVAFGMFIQPAPAFAGIPEDKNCHGKSVSALAAKYGNLNAAAAAFGFAKVQGLQDAIRGYCRG